MKIELLKENELNSVVGGWKFAIAGIKDNKFIKGFANGLTHGISGYCCGCKDFYHAAKNVIDNENTENKLGNFLTNVQSGTGNISGAVTQHVIAGAAVYGCFKVGKFVINKINKRK